MSRKLIVSAMAMAMAMFSLPALAATEFYVVKNDATKKCEVMDAKPDGKKMMMVGKDMFKSKAEAEAAMKTAADCK